MAKLPDKRHPPRPLQPSISLFAPVPSQHGSSGGLRGLPDSTCLSSLTTSLLPLVPQARALPSVCLAYVGGLRKYLLNEGVNEGRMEPSGRRRPLAPGNPQFLRRTTASLQCVPCFLDCLGVLHRENLIRMFLTHFYVSSHLVALRKPFRV